MCFVIRSWACRLGALLLVVLGIVLPGVASAQVCAAPGVGGSTTVSAAATVLNTYYPGSSAGGTAGGASIGYTSGSARGAATAIAAGDLVLIIQMQDGTGATTSNSSAYAFPANAAGNYEFARVLSLGAGSLNLTTGLLNSYTQNTAASSNQSYQVIRVPQYATLTIGSGASVVPMPWDGSSGGVVALDVAGAFTNNGAIDASYAGFRGNAGLTLGGVSGAAALTVATLDYVRPDTYTAHGGKGEGIGGTPDRVLNVFASPGVLLTSGSTAANGNTTNLTTAATYSIATNSAYLSTTSRSYNGGSRAAGGPANAGGGGDDSSPADNSENSGGGGGGNSGAGGIGGNTWNTNIALGGRGGTAASPSLSNRLIMGGGGGSGTTNNNYGLDASGGAGGGLILVKAGTVGGGGSLLANGQAGRSTIVVLAASGTIASAQVLGGQGGNINGTNHGPGGGGGLVVRSSALALSAAGLTGGAAGLMNLGGGSGTAYGATAGATGASSTIANTGLPAGAHGGQGDSHAGLRRLDLPARHHHLLNHRVQRRGPGRRPRPDPVRPHAARRLGHRGQSTGTQLHDRRQPAGLRPGGAQRQRGPGQRRNRDLDRQRLDPAGRLHPDLHLYRERAGHGAQRHLQQLRRGLAARSIRLVGHAHGDRRPAAGGQRPHRQHRLHHRRHGGRGQLRWQQRRQHRRRPQAAARGAVDRHQVRRADHGDRGLGQQLHRHHRQPRPGRCLGHGVHRPGGRGSELHLGQLRRGHGRGLVPRGGQHHHRCPAGQRHLHSCVARGLLRHLPGDLRGDGDRAVRSGVRPPCRLRPVPARRNRPAAAAARGTPARSADG
jgi:hypothetical protein